MKQPAAASSCHFLCNATAKKCLNLSSKIYVKFLTIWKCVMMIVIPIKWMLCCRPNHISLLVTKMFWKRITLDPESLLDS